MGKEACCHPETALVERLCTLRGYVGKKGETRRRSQDAGKDCQGMNECRTRFYYYRIVMPMNVAHNTFSSLCRILA